MLYPIINITIFGAGCYRSILILGESMGSDSNLLNNELGTLVQTIYQGARDIPPEQFQDWALEQVKSIIPFDSGKWVTGAVHLNQALVHDIHLHNQPRQMAIDYTKYQLQDRLLGKLIETRGRIETFDMYDAISRDEFVNTDLYTKYCKKYGQEHLISTAIPEPVTNLYSVISFYRKNFLRPFTQDDKEVKTFLTPILTEARKLNLFIHLNHSNNTAGAVTAISDVKGILREAESSFASMLHKQWPEWQGPQLPFNPEEVLGDNAEAIISQDNIVIHLQPWCDLVKIQIREKSIVDQLTPAEQQVTQHLIAGLSNKKIAKALNISPKTVSHHLQNIYKKAGVTSRTQTIAALNNNSL